MHILKLAILIAISNNKSLIITNIKNKWFRHTQIDNLYTWSYVDISAYCSLDVAQSLTSLSMSVEKISGVF